MNKFKTMLKNALINENPTFVSYLALCPTLGTTATLNSGFGMGISVIFVLILSNMAVSLIRKFIPNDIRIPVYITIIATVVTLLSMLLETYIPSLFKTLGIFLPLIVVNCIILGRAEVYASKNKVFDSMLDGLTVGISFTVCLCALGIVREIFGTGSLNLFGFNMMIFPSEAVPSVFSENEGAFIAFGILAWIFNEVRLKYTKKNVKVKEV